MTRTGSKIHRPSSHFRILVLASLLALAACASMPPPVNGIAQAHDALQAALASGASTYAPLEVGFAKDKLTQADAAMNGKDYANAANFAEESQANSELAQIKAQLGKLHEQIKQASADNARLRNQLLDNDDTTPTQPGVQP